MARNNIRSIRYSDEVSSIIQKNKGENFQDKFENLVLDYENTVKSRLKKVKELDKLILDKQNEINVLSQKIRRLGYIVDAVMEIEKKSIALSGSIKELSKQITI